MGDDSHELNADVYGDHPEPDSTAPQLQRIDSAVDVMIAAMRLAADTDII